MNLRLHVGQEGSEGFPDGWSDEIVAHTFRDNKDGTITVIVRINIYSPNGDCYSDDRVLRLKKGGNQE